MTSKSLFYVCATSALLLSTAMTPAQAISQQSAAAGNAIANQDNRITSAGIAAGDVNNYRAAETALQAAGVAVDRTNLEIAKGLLAEPALGGATAANLQAYRQAHDHLVAAPFNIAAPTNDQVHLAKKVRDVSGADVADVAAFEAAEALETLSEAPAGPGRVYFNAANYAAAVALHTNINAAAVTAANIPTAAAIITGGAAVNADNLAALPLLQAVAPAQAVTVANLDAVRALRNAVPAVAVDADNIAAARALATAAPAVPVNTQNVAAAHALLSVAPAPLPVNADNVAATNAIIATGGGAGAVNAANVTAANALLSVAPAALPVNADNLLAAKELMPIRQPLTLLNVTIANLIRTIPLPVNAENFNAALAIRTMTAPISVLNQVNITAAHLLITAPDALVNITKAQLDAVNSGANDDDKAAIVWAIKTAFTGKAAGELPFGIIKVTEVRANGKVSKGQLFFGEAAVTSRVQAGRVQASNITLPDEAASPVAGVNTYVAFANIQNARSPDVRLIDHINKP